MSFSSSSHFNVVFLLVLSKQTNIPLTINNLTSYNTMAGMFFMLCQKMYNTPPNLVPWTLKVDMYIDGFNAKQLQFRMSLFYFHHRCYECITNGWWWNNTKGSVLQTTFIKDEDSRLQLLINYWRAKCYSCCETQKLAWWPGTKSTTIRQCEFRSPVQSVRFTVQTRYRDYVVCMTCG